jgi:carotenoid cleavage dioxygenase-like enzyme
MRCHNLFKTGKKEFQNTKLTSVKGAIPQELKGTFYINTSVMTVRNVKQNTTWFDGDGAILRVYFEMVKLKLCISSQGQRLSLEKKRKIGCFK